VPIYEYQCAKCHEVFEAFQKITDEPISRCKYCNGKVEKLISQSSFQLKGSGWYLSDYARKSSGSSESAGTSVKSEKNEKTESTTVKKPDKTSGKSET